MENPFKNTGEDTLTPIERIKRARGEWQKNIAEGIGAAVPPEVLTRYVELYPEGAQADKIAKMFEDAKVKFDVTGGGRLDRGLIGLDMESPIFEDIEKEIGPDGMKKLMEGKNPAEQK